MALALECDDHGVLEDLKRAKKTKEYKQWEESIKAGNADMDGNSLLLMRFFLDKAEDSEIRERETGNFVVFDGEITGLGDEHYAGKSKETQTVYFIKDEKNLVPVVVRYEGDDSKEERGRKSQREKMSSFGKSERLFRRKPVKTRIPGKLVSTRENVLDNHFDHKSLREVVCENVLEGDQKVVNEAEVQKENKNTCSHPVSRNNTLVRNKRGCADVAQPSWSANVHPFLSSSGLIENKGEFKGVARCIEKNKAHQLKGEYIVIKKKHFVEEDDVSEKIIMVEVKNEHLQQKPGPQSNLFEHPDEDCEKRKNLSDRGSQQLIKRNGINADQSRHFKKFKKANVENITNRKNKANMGASVRKHQENFQHAEKVISGSRSEPSDNRELVIKKVHQDDAKNWLVPKGEAWSDSNGSHETFKSTNANEVNMGYRKMSNENDQGDESDDENIRDVEILDGAEYLNSRNVSSFVPSMRYNNLPGSSSMSDEFRKRVLDVLKRPFDKIEYKRHRGTLQEGSYLGYHPDLAKKLKKYRYKRGKCLNILRGFFFWLQNLTQQGAFKPWKDRTCLMAEPGSLQTASATDEPGEA